MATVFHFQKFKLFSVLYQGKFFHSFLLAKSGITRVGSKSGARTRSVHFLCSPFCTGSTVQSLMDANKQSLLAIFVSFDKRQSAHFILQESTTINILKWWMNIESDCIPRYFFYFLLGTKKSFIKLERIHREKKDKERTTSKTIISTRLVSKT